MFDKSAQQILAIRGPRKGRQYVQSTSATPAALDLTGAALDGYACEVFNEGSVNLYILLAQTSAEATALDPVARGNLTATLCACVPSNMSKRFTLGPLDKFLGYANQGGTGVMRVELNSDSGNGSSRQNLP